MAVGMAGDCVQDSGRAGARGPRGQWLARSELSGRVLEKTKEVSESFVFDDLTSQVEI